MKVQSIMTGEVVVCRPEDSLETAARLLWERDCGSLPVVDAAGRTRAMITDRDICMGAYTTGRPLAELRVADSMSSRLIACQAGDSIEEAARTMSEHALRRLPVVDDDGVLRGVVCLSDLARARRDEPALAVLVAVTRPRGAPATAAAAPAKAAPAPAAAAPREERREIRPATRPASAAAPKKKRGGKGSTKA